MAEHIPEDCFLRKLPRYRIESGRRIWVQGEGKKRRYYTWDALHDEVEVYNRLGVHLGALDPFTAKFTKDPVSGRHLSL